MTRYSFVDDIMLRHKGYLYNLYGNVNLITTYDYSQKALHAKIEDGLLYILTEEGIYNNMGSD